MMTVNFSNGAGAFNKMMDSVKTASYSVPQNSVKNEASDGKIASVRIRDVKKERTSSRGLIGISIGATVFAAIAGVFVITKGVSGGFYRKIAAFSDELKKKAYDLSVNVPTPSMWQKVKLVGAKIMQPVLDSFQSISNINVLKDGGVMLIAKWLKLTPVVDRINNLFKGIVLKTQKNAYNDAEYSAIKFVNSIEKMGRASNNSELVNLASEIRREYTKYFSTGAHYERSERFWESIKLLHGRVWNTLLQTRKNKNIKQYKSYITLEQTAPKRDKVLKELLQAKKYITNGIDDNYRALKDELKHIKINIKTKDEKAVEFVQKLTKEFEIYKKLNGTNEAAERAEVTVRVQKTIKEMLSCHKDKDNYAEIKSAADKIQKILDPEYSKKGKAQEIITIVKNQFGKKSQEYLTATSQLEKFGKNINKAIETEMNAYEKMAELRVGSAPTDILGILFPVALGMGLVINAKTKDEKMSKTLTQGIPILGGIATAYYGTTRMFTGPKNMAMGLATAYILNVIGTQVDNFYKSYREKQSLFKSTLESLRAYQEKDKKSAAAQNQQIS